MKFKLSLCGLSDSEPLAQVTEPDRPPSPHAAAWWARCSAAPSQRAQSQGAGGWGREAAAEGGFSPPRLPGFRRRRPARRGCEQAPPGGRSRSVAGVLTGRASLPAAGTPARPACTREAGTCHQTCICSQSQQGYPPRVFTARWLLTWAMQQGFS